MQREFVGWDRPLLESAEEWLFRTYASESDWDMRRAVIVVPGRRAGRRLLERLALRAERAGKRLIPPEIETLGVLPEHLYPLQRPLANELVQQLTWSHAIRSVKRSVLERIAPSPPADDDVLGWWALAKMLQAQHRELAADGLNFGDVSSRGHEVPGFNEADRWEALSEVQTLYLRTLDELGLWDVQTARLVAVRQREPRSDRDIVLVGTVDVNQVTRRMLDLVAESSPSIRVTALIGAPEEQGAAFDSHGCLLPAVWCGMTVDIPEADIRVCDGSAEQAEQVARELAALGGRYRADEVVIGLADEKLGAFVERELQAHGATSRWIEGMRLADSGPSRLLLALADMLEEDRFEEFAALVRHADVTAWMSRESADAVKFNLSALDEAFREHLPLGPNELDSVLANWNRSSQAEPVRRGLNAIRELLALWRGPERRINDWAEVLVNWLRMVYGHRVLDDSTAEGRSWPLALSKLNAAARDLADVPASLAPVVGAADAIRCVVQRLANEFVPPESTVDAVELLGWLDLWLDDTPAAVVTTFNEGFVPTSLNSDLFLPNELRWRLGLDDNSRRYARDAYAVTMLLQSRRETRWLVARRDPAGLPLVPSRLLLSVDPEDLPQRVLRVVGDPAPSAPSENEQPHENDDQNGSAASELMVPTPERIAELLGAPELLQPTRELTLNVTEFRTYLACRYRYFLRHVVKLHGLDDDAVELDGLAFGNVLHEVLRRFGQSPQKSLADSDKLQSVLHRILEEVADELFGSRRRAAVSVQLKQLESRLDAFAVWQANWRQNGWVIEHVERSIRPGPKMDPTAGNASAAPTMWVADPSRGEKFRIAVWLHGRIDRLDRNEQTGEWALFDYKSGDRGDTPQETHRKRNGEWIDLQLPLYRHLVRELSLTKPPRLGYINLPKDLNDVGACFAEWTESDLAEADETAAAVARSIAARDFWPMADLRPGAMPEFDDLCQVGVFGSRKHGT